MSEYIFVTNIFKYSNTRIYSSHSVLYILLLLLFIAMYSLSLSLSYYYFYFSMLCIHFHSFHRCSQVREFSRETSTLWRILQKLRPWESVTKVERLFETYERFKLIFSATTGDGYSGCEEEIWGTAWKVRIHWRGCCLVAGWQMLRMRASGVHRKVRVFYERKDPQHTPFCSKP